ncbi:cholesterol 7-desaturase nvd-like [Watersipora subatra]|uniref:cholesterol 7-desaturase nvd-like n=1 Tax=Watersipora subatra TaxID=2589382 RepID=UPI00355AF9E3
MLSNMWFAHHHYIGDTSVSLRTLIDVLFLFLITYAVVKASGWLYRLLFTMHEYVPNFPHLNQHRKNKHYGRVRKKNGEMMEADIPAIPNGWFYLLASVDLAKEHVKHVTACGLELAVFRDAFGEVYAVDAFCPHLGANMARGGIVKGSCLVCPFHAWEFSGIDGKCSHIPGAKKIPEIVKTKCWPVLERNEVVMLWYDAEDRDPQYLPNECEEITELGWKVHGRSEHTVYCHISEIPENGADIAHFLPVHHASLHHGSDMRDINKDNKDKKVQHIFGDASWMASKEDWYLAKGTLCHDLYLNGYRLPFAKVPAAFEQIGPGIVHLRINSSKPGLLLQFAVPIEPFKTRLVHLTLGPSGIKSKLWALLILRTEACMVERDICIWNNKLYSKRMNHLAGTDELIVRFRRWYAQFYSENSRNKTYQHRIDLTW